MVTLDGNSLTFEDVARVAFDYTPVQLDDGAIDRIKTAAAMVQKLAAGGGLVYGVTTGVGELRTVAIEPDERGALQVNILRSHAAGVGPHLSEAEARAMMLLRLNSFCQGHSGTRLETVQTIVNMLNRAVYPAIPEQGSLGASGDLAPLAHLALVLIGEGEAYVDGRLVSGAEALQAAGIEAVQLGPKEGLALINGTQLMTAVGGLACLAASTLLSWADASAALTLEALRANGSAFDPRIHRLRPYTGQQLCAARLRRLTDDSGRVQPYDPAGVQDAYSLRCIPQVHGAIYDVVQHVTGVLELEANSVTDNPLLFPADEVVLNGGNFHGQPLAMALDYFSVGIAELGNIAERRVERLVNPHLSGLPAFLAPRSGLHSGYMLAQYTAAALVSENKTLAHPASVDSIPTSANQEDHVSMGAIAARKARTILDNVRRVIAIELCCAAQAVDLSGGAGDLGRGSAVVYELVRSVVPMLEDDRVVAKDIAAVEGLTKDATATAKLTTLLAADDY